MAKLALGGTALHKTKFSMNFRIASASRLDDADAHHEPRAVYYLFTRRERVPLVLMHSAVLPRRVITNHML